MNRFLRVATAVVLFAALPMLLHAQEQESAISSLGLGSKLPVNPLVKIGKLENGLTYYIMQNKRPENRAEMRLVVNAGSILETDDQQGLAHFCEHMAFNGSENFKKNELVEYLESIGMRFGSDLNAYTSFDETVYMLELPMDDESVVDKGMQVLVDWASALSFENEEIDKERGVIMEEWRSRKSAASRIRDKQFPVLLHNSKYAKRLPIGQPEIIENFEYDTVKKFYRDWYRPSLMAVIAVGDFDVSQMEEKIKAKFGGIEKHPNPPKRETFEVPDHDQFLFTIESDPEATSTSVNLYHMMDPEVDRRVMDYRSSMIPQLYSQMLNARYSELLQDKNPPYIFASSGKGGFVRAKDVYVLNCGVKDGGIARGFETLLTEAERVKQHGFLETELERAKTNILRRMEQMYEEREKTRSGSHASEFVRNFLTEEPIPGIEVEYELYKKYLPTITIREVNKLTDELLREDNRVLAVSMPENEKYPKPTEEELRAIIAKVEAMKLEPYVDEVANKPLTEVPGQFAKVTAEKSYDDVGITEWTLGNGVHVLLKPTDFKDDEIQFAAWSPGGHSLSTDANYPSSSMADALVSAGGVGDFDVIKLRKALTGKVASVSPSITEESEGFYGQASPKDVETMLQLVNLYFKAPRKDTTAVESFKERIGGFLANARNRPESVFGDTLTKVLYQDHPRHQPMTEEWLKGLDLEVAYDFYLDRFKDASDFTFMFVGNFKPEELKPMVETWLGSLPSINRKETWGDPGIRYPKGVIKKKVYKGIDDKSMVTVVFTGDHNWSYENNYKANALEELLTIKLREEIREEKGGTYGVGVRMGLDKSPVGDYALMIRFGCKPERVDELTATLFDVLNSVRNEPADEETINKIKEIQRRERETNLKENGWWLGQMRASLSYGEPLDRWMQYDALVDALDADMLQETAQKYINMDNYVQVQLFPEEKPDDATGDVSAE
ncbi:insulinase family protein [bacterium]|nr:insulinase family protein [bacterium]